MENDYVSYELALKLKACGFDEPCDHYYHIKNGVPEDDMWFTHGSCADFNNYKRRPDDFVSAPFLWQAQKWLREKGIAVSVQANEIQGELWYSADIITTKGINELVDGGFDYMGYEAALSAGIVAALELIKKGV